ncbi:MAG: glycerol-3-phosphate dehydrogenase/oxidase [Gemmatimonadaceae bacterium]|nr:glycerol-3-phosphate dehydrogenase/oxidase [Gemmatimonadaceae bacterium]
MSVSLPFQHDPRTVPALGLASRAVAWGRLGEGPFDLLVVGGGITGAGTARDAALRGLKVAIVEADDWASGTSSRSSRLVHGGVRYLEHGHLHLVFEASRERRTLLEIAPHLVRPLRFTWPVYRGARIPRWKLRAGLLAYDALSLFRNVGRHRSASRREIMQSEPSLRADGLTGGAHYWDASTDDVRLTLANVVSASEAGAVTINHAPIVAFLHDAGGLVRGARVQDRMTGASLDVAARVIVNATGPWSDLTRRLDDGVPHAAVLGSKGVHIAVPRERVPCRDALTLLHPVDGRVFFILPSPVHTIIGTTETPAETGPDEIRANRRDVRYLLHAANHFFPQAALSDTDVISAWAGIRPLVAHTGTSANDASREHRIASSSSGLISVTGGKLTTYRAMASEITDAVEQALGRATSTASMTGDAALPGVGNLSHDLEVRAARSALPSPATAEHLVRSYGDRWRMVWGLVEREAPLGERLDPALPYLAAEVLWAAVAEGAQTVADVLVRRMPVAYERQDAGRALASRVAALLGRVHGWNDATAAEAAVAYDTESRRLFGIDD